MTIQWMIYAVLVGVLVALAACALEQVARWAEYPVRWIWAGAIVVTLALAVRASLRPAPAVVAPSWTNTVDLTVAPLSQGLTWQTVVGVARQTARFVLDAPACIQAFVQRRLPPALANTYVIAIWAACSTVLAVLFVGIHARFRRARLRWPRAVMHAVPVRVAPDVGPVVLGLVRPDVVVPRWLFSREHSEQRLVVAHEAEHIRARDPWLLALACVSIVLAPWNAALWYMLSRLRLAIELDCDARLLRAGATPASYGALLIAVAEQASPLRLSALALADDSSHLKQRILAMHSRLPRFALLRGAAAAAFGLVALLAACEATLPTSVQVDPADPASARQAARQLVKATTDSTIRFWVDGIQVTPLQARSIEPTRIAAIDVRKQPDGRSEVLIKTNAAETARKNAALDTALAPAQIRTTLKGPTFQGPIKFLLNGVEVDSATVHNLDKSSILSVEVVKGPNAVELYHVPEGTGVVAIKTKG